MTYLGRRAILLGGISALALSHPAFACPGGALGASPLEQWADRNPRTTALIVGGSLLAIGVVIGASGLVGVAAATGGVALVAGALVFAAGVGIGVVGVALAFEAGASMARAAMQASGESTPQSATRAIDMKQCSAADLDSASN